MPGPAATSDRWWSRLLDSETTTFLATCLFLLVLWTFAPALNNDFINYDDPAYVTANLHVQRGVTWENVKWAFHPNQETANWHPLTWLSHMLDCQIFGLNPTGHHLTSVLLHATNTVALFLVLNMMTFARGRSFFVAALFGAHPLHVESVVWVAERKDVLSTLFWFLTLWAWARFANETRSPNGRPGCFYGLALLFFLLGLLSKPMLVTLPFVLLLLDYWPLARFQQKRWRALVAEKAPFFLLATAAGLITLVVQKNGGAIIALAPLPLSARLGNALVSYGRYLGKSFWPENLAVFYPYPHPVAWPLVVVLPTLMVLAGITMFVLQRRRRSPYLPVGWFWFVGALVPVIGLVQVGAQAMADRYSYIPLIGLFVMLAWGLAEFTASDYQRRFLGAIGLAAVFLCVGLTRVQVGYWRDSGTLFRHAIAVTKGNYLAYGQLGNFLVSQNSPKEAIDAYRRAVQIYPNDAGANLKLGLLLQIENDPAAAIPPLEKVTQLEPGNIEAHRRLGLLWLTKGNAGEAIRQFQEGVSLNPRDAELHNNLGVALENAGRFHEAVQQCEEAVNLEPDFAKAHFNLGTALNALGRRREALAEITQAQKLQPDNPEFKKELK